MGVGDQGAHTSPLAVSPCGGELANLRSHRARAKMCPTLGARSQLGICNPILWLQVVVELAYLRSYERMGQARVECASGCTCEPSTLEGHHREKTSQVFLHELRVSQVRGREQGVRGLDSTTLG